MNTEQILLDHELHRALNHDGTGCLSSSRQPLPDETRCLPYLLAVEADRLTAAWRDGEDGRRAWQIRTLDAERHLAAAVDQITDLADQLAQAEQALADERAAHESTSLRLSALEIRCGRAVDVSRVIV